MAHFKAIKRGALAVSVLSGIILTVLFLLAVSFVMTKRDLSDNAVLIGVFAALAAGSLISGFFAALGTEMKGLAAGAICALIVSLIFISLIFAMNGFRTDLILLLCLPLDTVFGMTGGVIASNLR